ncbi:hypothetical protein [Pontibacter chinhatensis]|uniref:hypothetical protein n=1 Tax=Pontibacter chinhatensis TaxID=1436961 RepID=UPI0011144327|nr:hypothetical protein [Pontibacter chinhatensis]
MQLPQASPPTTKVLENGCINPLISTPAGFSQLLLKRNCFSKSPARADGVAAILYTCYTLPVAKTETIAPGKYKSSCAMRPELYTLYFLKG